MKEAIAKLMIATMMVDGEQSDSEHKTINTVLGVLGIGRKSYKKLLQEARVLKGVDQFIEWCRPSVSEITEKDDSGWKAISIVSMALVAMADTKIDPSESQLIAGIAEMLNVNIESLSSRKSA